MSKTRVRHGTQLYLVMPVDQAYDHHCAGHRRTSHDDHFPKGEIR
jgi:hypothetical protein